MYLNHVGRRTPVPRRAAPSRRTGTLSLSYALRPAHYKDPGQVDESIRQKRLKSKEERKRNAYEPQARTPQCRGKKFSFRNHCQAFRFLAPYFFKCSIPRGIFRNLNDSRSFAMLSCRSSTLGLSIKKYRSPPSHWPRRSLHLHQPHAVQFQTVRMLSTKLCSVCSMITPLRPATSSSSIAFRADRRVRHVRTTSPPPWYPRRHVS